MELNKYIDHTNLNSDTTLEDIRKFCDEAIKYHFHSVCVNPCYVSTAKGLLKDTTILVSTVIDYPIGSSTIASKEFSAIDAVNNGADEIGMVINIGALKNKDYDYLKKEIEDVRDSIEGKTLKIIIMPNYLTKDEISKITSICNETFVNFIEIIDNYKLDIENIKIIDKNKNDLLGIKVSGNIKNIKEIEQLIDLGVTRIGITNGSKIMEISKKEDKED